MAILKNGAKGGFSGKVGSVIGYQLNGQDVIRGWSKKRTKKPSKLEQANRDKFAQMQTWLKPLLDFLRVGFKNYAPTYQGFVAAKSYNSKHAFKQNADETYLIDPALALVSFGSMPLPQTISMELNGNEIVFNWSKEGNYQGIDQAMVLAYVPKTGEAVYDLAAAKRHTGTAILPMPPNSAGHEVQVYIAFVAYDQSAQSNSYYLGVLSLT
ncbi:hypothetical protein GM921_09505 [Pedobacter sp. LMG 31464]|uniref:Uncharacterized protein n=1 Tax=Pedobacter planticolens TaxID=2679964 RepID=A0A923DZ36_9SPHI|nr:DUF6266 family protein [Pedobacter planticolens]MBB2145721.1 hypothetical protein [Pedobacter planticolens]